MLISYSVSLIYIYVIWQRWFVRWNYLVSETRKQDSGSNPILYLKLLEGTAYLHYTVAVTYAQTFNGKKILKFLNKLVKYSNNQQKMLKTNVCASSNFSTILVKMWAIVITLIGLGNGWIYNHFTFDFTLKLKYAYSTFLWIDNVQFSENSTVTSSENILLVVAHTFTTSFRDLRDMLAEMFFVVGLTSLYLISVDFEKNIVHKDIKLLHESQLSEMKSYGAYKQITRLSRAFNEAQGYSMLTYLTFYLFYYSTKLDSVFLPDRLGRKIYVLEYFGIFVAIYLLGALFSHKVMLIKEYQ